MKEPYLILEKEVCLWADIFPATAITVRSRPHTPVEPCGLAIEQCTEQMRQVFKQQAQQAARTATLAENKRVLDGLRESLSHIRFQEEDMWFVEATISRIESLRQQETHP